MQEKPTQAELAKHLDMSERNLRDVLRALGLDHREATREAIRIAYIRDLRDKAAGRGGNEQASLAKSRIREAEANAQLKELQFHKEVGSLVPVADIEQLLDAWATAGRSELQNAMEKFATSMMSQHKILISQDQIDDAASPACRVIADYPHNFAGIYDQDGGEVVTA